MSVSCSWRNWIRDEPCVSLGVGINGMFLLCLTFCCHNLLGSWIHVRAGSSSHIWVYKWVGNRKKRDKHKHMRGDSTAPLNSPGSCSPAGWALPTPWEFVLVLICQCQVSEETWNSNKKFTVTVSPLHDKPYKQINFPHSKSWVLSKAGLGGQAGFDPSMVPLPCSSPCLCCSFPWQQTPNRSCRWGFILLGSSGKPWKLCRAADKFSEAALFLLKGCKHTPWSILPPATCVAHTDFFVYISTRTCRQCNLCLYVLWVRFFVCFAGRHK